VLAVVGLSLGAFAQAQAAPLLNYNFDTTIALTSPAINLVIKSGSAADSVVVNPGTVVVGLSAGETFTLTSASRDLSITGGSISNLTCSSGNVLTAVLGVATTFTITPLGGVCTPTVITGGGGYYIAPTPTTTPVVTPVVTPTPTPTVPTPSLTVPVSTPAASVIVPGAHPDGTLVNDKGAIYLIQNGQRSAFRNPIEYKTWGFNFKQVVAANDADRSLAVSGVNKAFDGSLCLDTSDGKTVYLVARGMKSGFVSMQVLKDLGYNLRNVFKINLSDYPSGLAITSAVMPHPNGALLKIGKTYYWSLNGQLQAFPSVAVFSSYGFSSKNVLNANAADQALPQGAALGFRDGTLIKDGSTYYLISDGVKKAFASKAALKAKGYNVSNAISANTSAIAPGNPL